MQESKSSSYSRFLASTHEFLSPFSFVLTAGYGFYFFYLNQLSYGWQKSQSAVNFVYVWRRGAARLSDTLLLSRSNASERFPSPGDHLMMDAAFLLPLIAIGITLYFILRSLSSVKLYKDLLTYGVGLSVLVLMPVVQLLEQGPHVGSSFLVCCIELILFAVLRFLFRRKWTPLWLGLPLLIAHITYWWLAPVAAGVRLGLHQDYPVKFAYVLALAAGVVWLSYIRHEEIGFERRPARSMRTSAWLCGVATCLLLWFGLGPRPSYAIAHSKNRENLEIVMRRTGCFGSCPIYDLTIHGDGRVEYNGVQFVAVCGKRSSSLTQEQLDEILRGLDEANFFSLDSRAFLWTYDVSSVWVTVSVDGKTKTVGAQPWSGMTAPTAQSKFENAAIRMDEIAGTSQWGMRGNYCSEAPAVRPSTK